MMMIWSHFMPHDSYYSGTKFAELADIKNN